MVGGSPAPSIDQARLPGLALGEGAGRAQQRQRGHRSLCVSKDRAPSLKGAGLPFADCENVVVAMRDVAHPDAATVLLSIVNTSAISLNDSGCYFSVMTPYFPPRSSDADKHINRDRQHVHERVAKLSSLSPQKTGTAMPRRLRHNNAPGPAYEEMGYHRELRRRAVDAIRAALRFSGACLLDTVS